MDITLMSLRTLGRRIANYYEKQVTTIKSELSEVEYVCTALDIWSMIDNGSTFVKAFQIFGVKLSNIELVDIDKQFQGSQSLEDNSESDDEETELMNPESLHLLPVHLRCCAHTLSLCSTTDANKILSAQNTTLSDMHAAVMKKCNVLWKAAARPKSVAIIQDVLQHTLSRPGETRCNSLFDSLKQIQSIKEKSLLLHRFLNIKNVIKENEFEYIKEYLICAVPVAGALDIMQSETITYRRHQCRTF
ncbi:unnamed protein product [Arctia plantaginis]|uniref:Transposase n=1 Tax=Arctia plantaginis TaxID=874455 RepID=A0A8S0YT38_ARCPL|nr:unnamed protein product [Arctia plantaginis]CAB3232012.1 unnamed protein product [Arctia plantaginis]